MITSINKLLFTAGLAAATFVPLAVRAEAYNQVAPLVVGANTLTIMPGSQAESLTASDDGFIVTVAAGEAFEVRTSASSRWSFYNDVGLPSCNVLRTRENQIIIAGPVTATVTLGTRSCSTDEASDNRTPMLLLTAPNGASTYDAGQSVSVFWTENYGSVDMLRLELSLDGGATYSRTLADGILSDSFFTWTVPVVPQTVRARMRVKGLDGVRIASMDVSDADFVIRGTLGDAPTADEPIVPVVHVPFDPAAVTAAADSIDHDRGLMPTLQLVGSTSCTPGVRIKGATSAAVYYCGNDGKRHAFPNQRIHDSWFQGWAGVVTLTDAELAAIPLGKNVTYRPGVRLVKVTTDPKVYAIGPNGTLRWIPDEWTARALYGLEWNKMVDDMPDSTFASDYEVGEMVPAVGA